MNLTEFLQRVKAGEVQCLTGVVTDDGLASVPDVLDANDIDAVTAEAYNQDAVDPDTPWDATRAAVVAALAQQPEPPEEA